MTFGTRKFKNGKHRGYLTFGSGKRVVLSEAELAEFTQKIQDWQYSAIEQAKWKQGIYKNIYGGAVSGRFSH